MELNSVWVELLHYYISSTCKTQKSSKIFTLADSNFDIVFRLRKPKGLYELGKWAEGWSS